MIPFVLGHHGIVFLGVTGSAAIFVGISGFGFTAAKRSVAAIGALAVGYEDNFLGVVENHFTLLVTTKGKLVPAALKLRGAGFVRNFPGAAGLLVFASTDVVPFAGLAALGLDTATSTSHLAFLRALIAAMFRVARGVLSGGRGVSRRAVNFGWHGCSGGVTLALAGFLTRTGLEHFIDDVEKTFVTSVAKER